MVKKPKIEHKAIHVTLKSFLVQLVKNALGLDPRFSCVHFSYFKVYKHYCHKRLLRYWRLKIVSSAFLLLRNLKYCFFPPVSLVENGQIITFLIFLVECICRSQIHISSPFNGNRSDSSLPYFFVVSTSLWKYVF